MIFIFSKKFLFNSFNCFIHFLSRFSLVFTLNATYNLRYSHGLGLDQPTTVLENQWSIFSTTKRFFLSIFQTAFFLFFSSYIKRQQQHK